jgi:hypothetical protein
VKLLVQQAALQLGQHLLCADLGNLVYHRGLSLVCWQQQQQVWCQVLGRLAAVSDQMMRRLVLYALQ